MMLVRTLGRRARIAVPAVAMTLAALGVTAGHADSPVATTKAATGITGTSAVLNGTLNTTDPDSAWTFQYGKTTSYGSVSPIKPIGATSQAVSVTLTGLSPGTTYHFQLIVAQGSPYPKASLGGDMTFTTTAGGGGGSGGGGGGGSGKGGGGGSKHGKFGHSSLLSRSLKVHGGVVSIMFKCTGASGAPCKGTTSLSAAGKLGKTTKTYGCGSAKFNTTAGKRATARINLSRNCRALLSSARNHKLGATLKTTFSTHQPQLKLPVTLLG